MNSQIFQPAHDLKIKQGQTLCLSPNRSMALQWLSIIVFIAAVILFPERPAWGSDADFQAGLVTIGKYTPSSDHHTLRLDQIQVHYRNPALVIKDHESEPVVTAALYIESAADGHVPALPIAYHPGSITGH